jgi:hypothetical protein
MRKILSLVIIACVAITFSSCSLLLKSGANMAMNSIQNANTSEQPNALQQATSSVTSSIRQVTGIRTQVPQGAQETICNENPCFTSACGQFELLSVMGNAITQEVTVTLLITQRLQAAPIRYSLHGIMAFDAEGNSYEMKEAMPESEWRNLPQNVPVRVTFRRIGPVPTSVDSFVYVQAASWDNTFEGACSPTFRNVAIVWN